MAQYLFDAFSLDNDDTADPFCTSPHEGMIMYMDGFRLSLAASSNNPCLNLYFPEWTLNTRSKFWCAMMGIIALGVVTEGISKVRSMLSKRLKGNIKRWSITFLHGLQALVGYILMLCTMTFSVELLACVIMGLALGFAIFYDEDGLHVTTNPCCNFIQEEFYERASTMRRQNLADEEAAKRDDQQILAANGQQRGTADEAAALTSNTVV